MLQITIPEWEYYDSRENLFHSYKEKTISLEHSLVSISKWESKWQKPFLIKDEKTYEESIDYIRCMTITQNIDPDIYYGLSDENMRDISEYINSQMTATWFGNGGNKKPSREIVTSELIYYWMLALNIPPEYAKWHLNRLFTLIRICDEKNSPKKMSTRERLERQKRLNEVRKKQLGTRG